MNCRGQRLAVEEVAGQSGGNSLTEAKFKLDGYYAEYECEEPPPSVAGAWTMDARLQLASDPTGAAGR